MVTCNPMCTCDNVGCWGIVAILVFDKTDTLDEFDIVDFAYSFHKVGNVKFEAVGAVVILTISHWRRVNTIRIFLNWFSVDPAKNGGDQEEKWNFDRIHFTSNWRCYTNGETDKLMRGSKDWYWFQNTNCSSLYMLYLFDSTALRKNSNRRDKSNFFTGPFSHFFLSMYVFKS